MSNEGFPARIRIGFATLLDIRFLRQAFGHDHMRQCIHQGHIGAGTQLQVVVGLNMGGAYQGDDTRINDDQLRTFAQAPLELRGEYRMAFRGICADQDNGVGLHDRGELLRSRGFTQGILQAVARGRVAYACAGIDVIVAERGAHELLHQVRLFVGAARRGNAANRILAVLGLDTLEFTRGVVDRLVPRYLAPWVADLFADHGLENTVFVFRIAIGETAFDAGVTGVGMAFAAWQDEARAFNARDLSGVDYVYVWADGIHVNIRLYEER